ncbi:FtsX-like permease family protein [Lacticaseibacillus absianus]|uniref:FtsX-like permease family protein n=1 Tax=Lacticaseibacillus absianus TaxID=2729623 RepID=UPI0015C9F517|nr:ABC transporter permease [Lacticaseibacillus absianus]
MRQLLATSLKRNATTNWLFVLVASAMLAVLYALLAITDDDRLMQAVGTVSATPDMVPAFLIVLLVLLLLFEIVFLLYLNGVMIMRRMDQIGVYRLLGMPTRRLAVLLVAESLLKGLATVGIGLGAGVLLSKFFVMMLMRWMALKTSTGLLWSTSAALELAGVYLLIFAVLGVLNALAIASTPLRRALNPTPARTPVRRDSGWQLLLTGFSLFLLGGAYVGAYNLISWTYTASVRGWSVPLLWGMILVAGLVGTYGLFRTALPTLAGVLIRLPQVRRRASALLTLTDLRKRVRHNSHSLFLTTLLATMTITVLGSGVIIYQFSQMGLHQAIALDGVTSARGRDIVRQQLGDGQIAQTVPLETKLAAGRLQGADGDGDRTLYNVISLSAYTRIRRVQPGLPALTLHGDQAVMAIYSRVLLQHTWLRRSTQWALTLPRTATHVMVTQITSQFPLGGTAYFDRALVVTDAVYRELKAPIDRLYGYKFRAPARLDKALAALDARDEVDQATYSDQALRGQRAVQTGAELKGSTMARSAIGLKGPLTRVTSATFGLELFIALLMGLTLMVATGAILLVKQLVAGLQEQASRRTLAQLGMPESLIRRVVIHQTLAVFALPLVFGALNAGLVIRLLSAVLDDPGWGAGGLLFVAVFALIYATFGFLTARLILRGMSPRA